MPLLNSAQRIYMGSQQIGKVMLGNAEVWGTPKSPAAGVAFKQARRNGNYAGDDVSSGTTGAMAGVVAGNSLILVVHTHASTTGAVNITPTPAAVGGRPWTLVSSHERQGDGWGDYRHRVSIFVLTNAAAGSPNVTISFPVALAYSAYLVEVTGTPTLATVGYAVGTAYQNPPVSMSVATAANPAAGPSFVLGGGAATHSSASTAGVDGSTGYTDTVASALNGTYFSSRQQYKPATHTGSAPETWAGSKAQISYGFLSYVAVFK